LTPFPNLANSWQNCCLPFPSSQSKGLTLVAGAALLEPRTQPTFALLIFRIGAHTCCLGYPQTLILLPTHPELLGLQMHTTTPGLYIEMGFH
jgi:hypothetical protein